MNTSTRVIYKEVADRYIKVVWTHKIHEIQADLYHKKSECVQSVIGWLTGMTAAGALGAILPFFSEKVLSSITAILALILSYYTYRYKDGILDARYRENKEYAAKVHHLRNLYGSLLSDMKAEVIDDIAALERRNQLEDLENELYTQNVPYSSKKAVDLASRALKGDKESTTTDEEVKQILPDYLQI